MVHNGFADRYRIAALSPAVSSEIMGNRQAALEQLQDEIQDIGRMLDLVRLYFGLSTIEPMEWFSDAFRTTDPAFSMCENEQEVAVLAECLLAEMISDGNVAAGLAIMTTSARKSAEICRSPLIQRSALISETCNKLRKLSLSVHAQNPIPIQEMKTTHKSDVEAKVNASTGDWASVGEILKLIGKENSTVAQQFNNKAVDVFKAMERRIKQVEEESNMLWWLIGRWSQFLDIPFSDLDASVIPSLAGLELADLTEQGPGPVAVPAILHRLINEGRKTKLKNIAINTTVNGLLGKLKFTDLGLGDGLNKDNAKIFPILTAMRLADELGVENGWEAAFAKQTGLEATTLFQPEMLAMQAYRERLLLKLLNV